MIALVTAPVRAEQQAILFYLYVQDVAAYHAVLSRDGLQVRPLAYPDHSPAGEFRLEDPAGYCILVGQV